MLPSTRDTESVPPARGAGDRLDSWKAIATHLGRSVRTVQRWRRTAGLPVHHVNNRIGAVYANRHELDAWWRGQASLEPHAPAVHAPALAASQIVPAVADKAPLAGAIDALSGIDARRRGIHAPRFAIGAVALVVLLTAATTGPTSSSPDQGGSPRRSDARAEYLRGRAFLARATPLDITRAIDAFERAVERDPSAAAAHAGLAQAYARAANVVMPIAAARHKSLDALNRALALDSRTADAYVARGLLRAVERFDMAGALADFGRAETLQGGGVLARLYGGIALIALGRPDDGLSEIERAQREDPTNLKINARLGMAYAALGDPERGVAQCRRTLALEPFSAEVHFCLGYALERGGHYDRAIADYRTAQQLGMRALPSIARALARSGRADAAYTILATLDAARRRGAQLWPAYEIAQVYAALGDSDAAFDCLDRAFDERDSSLVGLAIDPDLRTLHADARFATLIERTGLRVLTLADDTARRP